jgi:beta-lactamase regulating signal transducer with metallopeptidase domain
MPSLFLDVAVRAALIALGTACTLWALRIRTAAVRHAAWTTVVIAMLLLPIWSVAGPKIPLAVLPASAVSPEVDFAPANLSPQPSVPQPGATQIAATASTVTDSPRGLWVFIGVYVFGLSALLIRLAIGTSHAHRLRRKAVVHAGRATSARCATPITVGWLSPVLILPKGWERWSAGQLDAVLTHEYEHARRHDPLVQWLALLNRAIFWFHPLAWWLERHLAKLAEEACDAAVIRAGHSPQDYSDYLIDMAHALRRQGRRLNVAGMAMPGSGLPDRMRHIFEERLMTPTPRTRVICTLAFCTTSSVIFAAGMLAPRPSVARTQTGAVAHMKSDVVLPNPAPSQTPHQARTGAKVIDGAHPLAPKPVESRTRFVSATDFTGIWALVSATTAGRGRGGIGGFEPGGFEREVKVTIASGAPVNCGVECTIVQNDKTLTISRVDQPGTVAPDIGVVVLNLDGSESTITQSNGSDFSAKAKSEAGTLVVTRDWTDSSVTQTLVTQTLSIENARLKVVTTFSRADAPVTMTYERR